MPRSIIRQRSEQKGRFGLSFHSAGLPQIGHFMICHDTTKRAFTEAEKPRLKGGTTNGDTTKRAVAEAKTPRLTEGGTTNEDNH